MSKAKQRRKNRQKQKRVRNRKQLQKRIAAVHERNDAALGILLGLLQGGMATAAHCVAQTEARGDCIETEGVEVTERVTE